MSSTCAPLLLTVSAGSAAVQLAVVGDVVQRVDVGVAVAVALHAEVAHREPELPRADVPVVHLGHVVDGGARIVGAGDRVDRDRHRDVAARLHESARALHVRGRQQVQGAADVVVTPAAPVLDGFEDGLELLEGHVRGSTFDGAHPATPLAVDVRRPGSNSTATGPVNDGPAGSRYARVAWARNEIVNVAPWQAFATVDGIATWSVTVFCLCARMERRRRPAEAMPRLAAVARAAGLGGRRGDLDRGCCDLDRERVRVRDRDPERAAGARVEAGDRHAVHPEPLLHRCDELEVATVRSVCLACVTDATAAEAVTSAMRKASVRMATARR